MNKKRLIIVAIMLVAFLSINHVAQAAWYSGGGQFRDYLRGITRDFDGNNVGIELRVRCNNPGAYKVTLWKQNTFFDTKYTTYVLSANIDQKVDWWNTGSGKFYFVFEGEGGTRTEMKYIDKLYMFSW